MISLDAQITIDNHNGMERMFFNYQGKGMQILSEESSISLRFMGEAGRIGSLQWQRRDIEKGNRVDEIVMSLDSKSGYRIHIFNPSNIMY